MYEKPEVLELGDASLLTQGRRFADYDDGLPDRYRFIPLAADWIED